MGNTTENNGRKVYIVSDGAGRTCTQVVNAVLVQFQNENFQLVKRANVRTKKRAVQIIQEAAGDEAVVFYTLISDSMRATIKLAADKYDVATVDVLGPTLSALKFYFVSSPQAKPGLYYQSQKDYFDRVDAINYTLKHDDGVRIHELSQADVVLVGVSRVSKSSTCFYLGYRGINAANVPLLPNCEPPRELLKLDPSKVIGLTTNLHRLQGVRIARMHSMGVQTMPEYTSREAVAAEIRTVNIMIAQYGWRSIDVSYRAIEEVAREVMRLLGSPLPDDE